ncbi:MAG: hypothetical protein R6U57_13230 [Anaerolineales bacterium]
MEKFLGILVTPDDVQNEGLEPVFDNIAKTGAKAISFAPWISHPAGKGRGSRLPDLHIDGYKRRLDRPLFGKREVYLESFLSYTPDEGLYSGGIYSPPTPAPPSDLDKDIPHQMIDAAHKNGMAVHVEVVPFLPPNVKPKDRPHLINNIQLHIPKVADRACLNSPDAQYYGLALIEDTLNQYPEVDGVVLDWAEFSAYLLTDHFSCFCEHCEAKALNAALDWLQIKQDVRALWDWLHSLTPDRLLQSIRVVENVGLAVEWLMRYPGWLDFFKLKAQSVEDFYKKVRSKLDLIGKSNVEITARGWPTPFNLTSGMDYRALSEVCDVLAPKIFTFDHTAMPRWHGQQLMEWNADLPESLVLKAVVSWLNLPDKLVDRKLTDYQMPAPNEFHPIKDESYGYRIDEIANQVAGKAQCCPYVHAYRNEEQWREIISILLEGEADGMWVQMYGYLSDQKIQILSQEWK